MTTHGRPPAELDAAIERHKELFGQEPELIMIQDTYRELHRYFFTGRLYVLCCGRGALYAGIPAILTSANSVETFLICY